MWGNIVSPSICHEVMGLDAMILVFCMLSFKSTFSLSSFTFIKRLFSSSSFSAIKVVSSAYLRLLIFLPAMLIPAWFTWLPAMRETWIWCLHWKGLLEKEKLTTPVFWPGEFHGLYSPWGLKDELGSRIKNLQKEKRLLLLLSSFSRVQLCATP